MAKGNKKNIRNKRIIYEIIAWIIIIFAVMSWYNTKDESVDASSSIKTVTAKEAESIQLEGDELLQIHFFDVGQADSILLVSNNETMLIDAGTNDTGKTVVKNIENLGITKIDYLVGTHPHEDHIGGLDDVIKSFDIGTIYMPDITTDKKTYLDVIDEANKKEIEIISPKKGDIFNVGDVKCEIMLCDVDLAKNESNLNLASIVIRATFKEQSYLFMADSQKENEITRDWPQTNVLKVGHHGSKTSTSAQFLKQVSPQIAIIQCGKDNDYGYPKQVILDKLNKLGTLIYRTDENKNILLESDGLNNKISFYE